MTSAQRAWSLADATTTPLTAQELAERLHSAFAAGFLMYASVESQMFSSDVEVAMLPLGPTPDDVVYSALDRSRPRHPSAPSLATVVSRMIPDLRIAGTATARSADLVVGDFTMTGTLPDGWLLHLHTEFECVLEQGLVVRYLVKNRPEEFQRYVAALGDPYANSGLQSARLQNAADEEPTASLLAR